MKKNILLIVLVLFALNSLKSQNYNIVSSNSQTVNTCTGYFTDNSSGDYAANQDLTVTFASNNTTNTHISISFISFDIHASDTLYVFDGPNISSPLIGKFNNTNPLSGGQNMVQSSVSNSSGRLTFRFKTNSANQGSGWNSTIICAKPCQKIIATLDSLLTVPEPNDSNYIDVCLGSSITFKANALFPQNDSVYHQSNNSSKFYWDFGDGTIDSGQVVNKTYTIRRGYDIMLKIIDTLGCRSINALGTRVRISSIPTTTIKPLDDMCGGNTKLISVGYNQNSSIIIEPMAFTQTSKQGFDSTMFLPDGNPCASTPNGGIYNTFVTFNNFPQGATIQSASDILSICVNMEHTFAGDLGFRIYCPNGSVVTLDPNTTSSGNDLGISNSQDAGGAPGACDPTLNPPGIGWTYCWSEFYPNDNLTLANLDGSISTTRTVMVNNKRTIDSTNQTNHTKYIKPENPLSGLIGCPLNGVWNLQIKDDYTIDNGYIFGWNLELTANLMPNNWTYNVKIDSVGFTGPFISPINDTTALISPLNGGNFTYNISLVDDFGCVWDTLTTLKVIQMPNVNLGNDTAVCSEQKININAGNPGATYVWDTPFGPLSTQTLLTSDSIVPYVLPLNYIVTASYTNASNTLICSDMDTLVLTVNPMPNISYSVMPINSAGCEPLLVSFINETSPAIKDYLWEFGDGAIDTATNPSHIYSAGVYNVTLTATTIEGCTDKFVNNNLVKSYPQPVAEFSWNPMIGVIQDPQITFTNLTTPTNSVFTYNWIFGTDGNSSDKDPVHLFSALSDYTIQLAVTSDKGCMDTIEHTVKIINDILEFPNIITPNGDGKNDKFVIKGLLDGGYPDSELAIYNRWGKKVYSKINYQNDFGGEDLSDGVYFYIFKARGILREMEQKGSLQILR